MAQIIPAPAGCYLVVCIYDPSCNDTNNIYDDCWFTKHPIVAWKINENPKEYGCAAEPITLQYGDQSMGAITKQSCYQTAPSMPTELVTAPFTNGKVIAGGK